MLITSSPHVGVYVSSLFIKLGEYFVVVDAPPVGDPVLTRNRLVRTINVIASVRPELVILGPMEPEERDALEAQLGGVHRIDLRTPEETVAHFGVRDEFRGRLLGAAEEDVTRLLWQGAKEKAIQADDLVCLESRAPLTDIAIANLAFATGADLRWLQIPAALTDVIQSEDEFLRSSSRARSVGHTISEVLAPYHRALDLTAYRTVTFITKATPHGLVTPPGVTVAHLLHIADLPHVLTNMMLYEMWEEPRTYTAIICDPGFFQASETEPVSHQLEQAKWKVRQLKGDAASYDGFDAHIQFFPHDLLLILAHGGTVSGQYQVWLVRDPEGHEHTFECERVMALSGVRPDGQVRVIFLTVPVRVDGVFWNDSEGKKVIKAGDTLTRFLNLHKDPTSPELVLRAAYHLPEVSFSNAIALHKGSAHFQSVHSLGFREYPVVFNNSCSSWADLGVKALHAGARAYVCTARSVEDRDATMVAARFIEHALRGLPLAEALQVATTELPRERNPYIYVGRSFSTLKSPPPGTEAAKRWKEHAGELRDQMAERLGDNIDADLQRRLQEAVVFIDDAMRSFE